MKTNNLNNIERQFRSLQFKRLLNLIFALVFSLMSCSSSDDSSTNNNENDNNNGNTNNPNAYNTVSQNVVDQEFFIEGIYFSGPGSERPKTVPHSVTVPIISKNTIAMETGIDVDQVTVVTIIGQRLTAELVTDSDDITRIGRNNEPYDSSMVTFILTNEVSSNATLTTLESFMRSGPFNDTFVQTNKVIEAGRFKITATNPANRTLGATLDDNGDAIEAIQSITFIANQGAFQDPSNGFMETNGTTVVKFTGDFQEFFDALFNTETNQNIVVIRTRTGINGITNTYDYWD